MKQILHMYKFLWVWNFANGNLCPMACANFCILQRGHSAMSAKKTFQVQTIRNWENYIWNSGTCEHFSWHIESVISVVRIESKQIAGLLIIYKFNWKVYISLLDYTYSRTLGCDRLTNKTTPLMWPLFSSPKWFFFIF